jgi:MYXO-CTERM domain-containing protein
MLRALPLAAGVATALVVAAPVAQAHVLLDEPQRRYDDMKGPPCGRGDGQDGRTELFTRYQAGETITVRFTETVDHVGSFRVAFDEDGADAADFDANVLLSMDDPDNESGQAYEVEVQLPDVTCTNCTLQLQQVMTTSPTPSVGQIYHQCADLVLGDGDSAPAAVDGGLPGSGCSADGADGADGAGVLALAGLLLVARRRTR